MEHRMQIQSNCMRYSIILQKFAKRVQIAFGAVAKGNLLHFRMYWWKQKNYLFLMTTRSVFSESLWGHFELQYLLTTKLSNMNTIMAAILFMYKIEHRIHICLRNLRIACSTDHVSNIPQTELYLNKKKQRRHLKICVLSAFHVLIKATHSTQPYYFQDDLIWCDGTFKISARKGNTSNFFSFNCHDVRV